VRAGSRGPAAEGGLKVAIDNAYETMLFNLVRMTKKEKEEKERHLATEAINCLFKGMPPHR